MSGVIGFDMCSMLRCPGVLFAINVNHVRDAHINGCGAGTAPVMFELSKFCGGTIDSHHDWLYTYVTHQVIMIVNLP